MQDKLISQDGLGATVQRAVSHFDELLIKGKFIAECRDSSGKLKWRDEITNTVVTVGKNSMLDNFLAGSSFTQTGPFMGLISSVGFSAIAASDTMTSHPGWTEAGNANAPTYTGTRKTCVWSVAAAGAKALSAALTFAIGSTGTVKGAFLVLAAGAVNTIDNTAGTLFSAGLFGGGDRPVGSGDTLSVSYSCSL